MTRLPMSIHGRRHRLVVMPVEAGLLAPGVSLVLGWGLEVGVFSSAGAVVGTWYYWHREYRRQGKW